MEDLNKCLDLLQIFLFHLVELYQILVQAVLLAGLGLGHVHLEAGLPLLLQLLERVLLVKVSERHCGHLLEFGKSFFVGGVVVLHLLKLQFELGEPVLFVVVHRLDRVLQTKLSEVLLLSPHG